MRAALPAGQCFQAKEVQYTYEACFFDKALQKEGHNRPCIGKWQGFQDNYRTALFDNGDPCFGVSCLGQLPLLRVIGDKIKHFDEVSSSNCTRLILDYQNANDNHLLLIAWQHPNVLDMSVCRLLIAVSD